MLIEGNGVIETDDIGVWEYHRLPCDKHYQQYNPDREVILLTKRLVLGICHHRRLPDMKGKYKEHCF